MMMDILHSLTGDVISKSLDGHYARQKAIVSNISNAETPGYKARNVDFQTDLKNALERAKHPEDGTPQARNDRKLSLNATLPGHFGVQGGAGSGASSNMMGAGGGSDGASSIQGVEITSTSEEVYKYRNDGNGVDLEREMVALSKNSGQFKALITFQSRTNQQLKNVIQNNG
jgi:flagellar basal-body rod protein FlgB